MKSTISVCLGKDAMDYVRMSVAERRVLSASQFVEKSILRANHISDELDALLVEIVACPCEPERAKLAAAVRRKVIGL